MIPAYEELEALLDELVANVNFTALSASLRPRLADALRWEIGGDAIGLARDFMSARAQPENIYSALLVRAVAAFERFARGLVDAAAIRTAATRRTYEDLSEHVRSRHAVLTGRLLTSLDDPFEYQVVNVKQLAENLASCVSGASPFRLNASAFAAIVTSGRPQVIERALSNLDIDGWWDAVGAKRDLQTLLGTRGPRDTSKVVTKRLDDLCRRRNRIAHGGDGDVIVTESDVRQEIQFLRTLAEALCHEVDARLR